MASGSDPLKLTRARFSALALFLISVLICVAYGNTLSVPFHFDDDIHITENHYIRITEFNLERIKEAAIQDGRHNRPFSNLSFALNYFFFAEKPWSYHIVNLFIHIFCASGVFFLVDRTLRLAGYPEELTQIAAAISTAAWAVHPINTQAVTYIVQRQTLMASAFMVYSLAAYVEGRLAKQGRKKYILYALSGLSFILAAGSKEIALVTPVLILLYEFFFLQKFSLAFIRRRKVPLIVIAVLLASLLAYMLRPEMLEKITSGYDNYSFSMKERLLTEPRVIIYYLSLIILPLPSRLSLEHDFAVSTSLFHPWTTLPAILAILAALVWPLLRSRRRQIVGFATLWYLVNLFMESSFIPLDLVNEHRLYMASLAVIIPLFSSLPLLTEFSGRALSSQSRLVIPSIVILLLLSSTLVRNRDWQSPLSLWQDNVAKAPGNSRSWNNLCAVQARRSDFQSAIASCEKALSIDDRIPDAYNNLGIARFNLGQMPEARKSFEKAVELNPAYAVAHFNLAEFHRLNGNMQEAAGEYQATLKADPYYIPAHINLGHTYYNAGELDKAIEQYRTLTRLSPKLASGYLFLARALYRKGQWDECLKVAEQGLELDQSISDLWLLKGSSLLKMGELEEASYAYAKLLDRDMKNPDAYIDLGQIYLFKGMLQKAEDTLYHVKFLHPEHPRIPELERMIEEYKKLQNQQPE